MHSTLLFVYLRIVILLENLHPCSFFPNVIGYITFIEPDKTQPLFHLPQNTEKGKHAKRFNINVCVCSHLHEQNGNQTVTTIDPIRH